MAPLTALITAKGFQLSATAVAAAALLSAVMGVVPLAAGLVVAAVSGLAALWSARRSHEKS